MAFFDKIAKMTFFVLRFEQIFKIFKTLKNPKKSEKKIHMKFSQFNFLFFDEKKYLFFEISDFEKTEKNTFFFVF